MSGTQQTAQALGGPGGQLGGGGAGQDVGAKLKQVGAGVQEVIQLVGSIPGADQQKVQQAQSMVQQAAQLLIAAVPKGQARPQ